MKRNKLGSVTLAEVEESETGSLEVVGRMIVSELERRAGLKAETKGSLARGIITDLAKGNAK